MSEATAGVTLQFIALIRTRDWLTSTTVERRRTLSRWSRQVRADTGALPELLDDKGGLVRFAGPGMVVLLVREWAVAHPGSVRVLP